MINTKIRQLDYILSILSVRPLDKITAIHQFNILQLPARIYDLKKLGYIIQTDFISLPSNKHVAIYSLINSPVSLQLDFDFGTMPHGMAFADDFKYVAASIA